MNANNDLMVNPESLARLRELDDPDLLAELIGIYLMETPQLLEAMSRAFAQHDTAALRNAAHTLKGSSGNLGADGVARLCQSLESLARAGSWDGVEQSLIGTQQEFERVKSALGKEMTR